MVELTGLPVPSTVEGACELFVLEQARLHRTCKRVGEGYLPGTSVASGVRVMSRMLIIAAHGGPVVVPVDEVDGIHAIDERILDAASRSGEQASAKYPVASCNSEVAACAGWMKSRCCPP